MNNILKINLIITLAIAMLWAGCVTTRTSATKYVGNWSYLVKNLPDGDVKGTMVISQEGETFKGDLLSEDGNMSLKMEDLKIEDDILSTYFYFQGMKINMNGKFNGNDFDGTVSVDYNEFPVTARKVN